MTQPPPDWSSIETVFLDMDGTLLDLNYDNQVWNHAVPQAYAKAQGLEFTAAQAILLDHMRDIHGTIEFYSFDYWGEFTGLDLVEVHRRHRELVQYRAGALEFLRWLKRSNKTSIIATNAHRGSVGVKDEQVNISVEVDLVVSSQDFQAPKESIEYWQSMQTQIPFDPERSIFVDDNEPVLDHARDYGIAHLWAVATPDSTRPSKQPANYPAFDSFFELCAELG